MISGNCPPIHCGIGDYTANLLGAIAETAPSLSPLWLSRKQRWFTLPIARWHGVPIRRPWHKWEHRGIFLALTYLKWRKPDIVHLQEEFYSYMEGSASLQLARSTRCPLIVTLHAYHLDPKIERQTKQVIERADRVICSDRKTADRMRKGTGRRADLIGWCSSPVYPQILSSEEISHSKRFTTFGFVHPGKMNFGVVGEALKQLNAKQEDIEWKIIGPMDREGNPHHIQLLQELNGPWVEFTGRVDDLNDECFHHRLARMTAMLLPFRNKTSPNGTAPSRSSLQIAWAFGLPVVASKPIEEDEELRDGNNCLLVDEDDPDAWQVAIEKILNDQALRKTLRQGSLDSARRFGWKRLAKEHMLLYEGISS